MAPAGRRNVLRAPAHWLVANTSHSLDTHRRITAGYIQLAHDMQRRIDPDHRPGGTRRVLNNGFAFAPHASQEAGKGMLERTEAVARTLEQLLLDGNVAIYSDIAGAAREYLAWRERSGGPAVRSAQVVEGFSPPRRTGTTTSSPRSPPSPTGRSSRTGGPPSSRRSRSATGTARRYGRCHSSVEVA